MLALRPLAAALLLTAFCTPGAIAQTAPTGPPVAAVRPITNTYFGTTLTDPYQWMEHLEDPEVKTWFKGQSDYSRAYLDKIPGRATLLARITALDHAGVSVQNVQYGGGMYFYEKTTPEGENGKLYLREGLTGAERVLFDPETLTKNGVHYSLDTYAPSLDGKYVAYAASPGGSEHGSVYVLETATGNKLPDVISRTAFTTLSWLPDGRSFFYVRMPQLAANAPPSEQDTQARVYVHHLGADPEGEPPVFGYGVSKQIPATLADSFAVTYTPASPYAFAAVEHGVQPEISLYAAPLASVSGPKTPWRKIADVPDAVTGFDARGDDLYLLTHKGASRYKIVRVRLSRPDVAHATVVVPPSDAVIESLGVSQDALYMQDLVGGLGRVRRVGSDGKIQPVALPFYGSVTLSTDPRLPGALIRLGGWTRSSLYYVYDPTQNTLTDSGLKPADPTDFSAITSSEVMAKSADGTLVPLSIVYRKALTLDGTHPTLLEGYGSYGYSIKPGFNPTSLAWLERGGILAAAHVRGGGEYGEDWHQAGMKLLKPNSWHDLYACAYYLIEHGYTSSAHLACKGTSAGGDLINPAYVERPSLFAAAVSNVGDTDAVRFELMPGGPSNIAEFGTATDPLGFQGLYAMDAYQHVRDGVAYPAVLLTTGINDPRVSPWEPAKMTARLQAATSSGKPVLLRVDYDAGHGGIDTTKAQRDSEEADEDAFLFQQLGDPALQPAGNAPVQAVTPITVTGE